MRSRDRKANSQKSGTPLRRRDVGSPCTRNVSACELRSSCVCTTRLTRDDGRRRWRECLHSKCMPMLLVRIRHRRHRMFTYIKSHHYSPAQNWGCDSDIAVASPWCLFKGNLFSPRICGGLVSSCLVRRSHVKRKYYVECGRPTLRCYLQPPI